MKRLQYTYAYNMLFMTIRLDKLNRKMKIPKYPLFQRILVYIKCKIFLYTFSNQSLACIIHKRFFKHIYFTHYALTSFSMLNVLTSPSSKNMLTAAISISSSLSEKSSNVREYKFNESAAGTGIP